MQKLVDNLIRKGETLSTAAGPGLRLIERPNVMGGWLEDLGSTLQTNVPNKGNQTVKKPKATNAIPTIKKPTTTRRGPSRSRETSLDTDTVIELSDSDDEMDLLSQKEYPDPSSQQMRLQASSTHSGLKSNKRNKAPHMPQHSSQGDNIYVSRKRKPIERMASPFSSTLDTIPVASSSSTLRSSPQLLCRASSPTVPVRRPAAFPLLPSPVSQPKRTTNCYISPLRDSNLEASFSRHPILSPPHNQKKGELGGWRRTHAKRSTDKEKLKENDDDSLFTEPEDGSSTMAGSKSSNGKGKGTERSVTKKQKKPRNFPMSTQMLESIRSSPPADSQRNKRWADTDSDDGRSKKKLRRVHDSQSPSFAFEDEGDSILNWDPQSLCPYCDSRLPAQPSALLVRLLAATREKATPDPRPSNPLGLKAPMAVFVSVCQRHRFESKILPEAQQKGWPNTIEWKAVAERVKKMRHALQALIDDVRVEDEWELPYCQKGKEKSKRNGPRSSSIFWNEVMAEIKKKGTRAAAGVRGQFANFEKVQPGYYGEQGSAIINQTLYDMFPPGSMDPHSIAPLTGTEFMQKIFVPEVALRLIMEDKNLRGEEGRREALVTLRESSTYGVFMFPEDGDVMFTTKPKVNQLGVGDMIVMERAMKRRKELEQEEERLLAMERERTEDCMTDTGDNVEAMKVGRPPKPRPMGKAASTMSVASSQSSTRHRSRIGSIYGDPEPACGINTAIEITDSESDVRSTRRRSPPIGRGRKQRRSRPNFSSQSESDSGAFVSRPCTRSRSSSNARLLGHEVHQSIKEEDDVGFTDCSATPRRCGDTADEMGTPMMAQPPKSPKLAPLLRAQQRRQAFTTSEQMWPRTAPSTNPISTEKTRFPLPSRQHLTNRISSKTNSGDIKTSRLPPQRNAPNGVTMSKSSGARRTLSTESRKNTFNWLLNSDEEAPPV